VNLIVGKNSVGKTCLLEAVRLYAAKAQPFHIFLLFLDRGTASPYQSKTGITINNFMSLFYGRRVHAKQSSIEIGRLGCENNKVSLQRIYCIDDIKNPSQVKVVSLNTSIASQPLRYGMKINHGGNFERIYQLPCKTTVAESELSGSFYLINNYFFIPSSGIYQSLISDLWDDMITDGRDPEVMAILKSIDKNIERLNMVANSEPDNIKKETDKSHERIAVVKTKQFEKPVPLNDLGEGLMRVFGMAMAAIKASDGFLLIDEFEIGLHHGIQMEMWRFIFSVAKESNIQVFATTHSWDCVEAFQKAAAEDQNEEAMLIRLARRKNGQIHAISYNEEELSIATEQYIEVR
jgi:AAA15 family ATPase/GTPase